MSDRYATKIRRSVLIVASLSWTLASSAWSQTVFKELVLKSDDSPITRDSIDCSSTGATTLVIKGEVELVRPDDNDDFSPQTINVRCENMLFEASAMIKTRSSLMIEISGLAAGPITLVSTRGVAGRDGAEDHSIYTRRQSDAGAPGGAGGAGGDASNDPIKGNHSSKRGDNGAPGAPGTSGLSGADGASGHSGIPGARIALKAGRFSDDSPVTIRTQGGNGGSGTKGGRGVDGGAGGRGGDGGKGGNAAVVHPASRGGDGGNGGNGGNGGFGGRGGDGGGGGNGGDVIVYITSEDGRPPSNLNIYTDGGKGGNPGFGGDPGAGGIGGAGGAGGCGGSGKDWGPVVFHGPGSCGGQGDPGKNGIDGQPGPNGAYGRDGVAGNPGKPSWGRVFEENGAKRQTRASENGDQKEKWNVSVHLFTAPPELLAYLEKLR